MIIAAKSSFEQIILLESLTEEEKRTTIVLANPWQSKDYYCNKAVYDKNMNQIMNLVNRSFPEKTEAQRMMVAKIIFNDKVKEFGWECKASRFPL